MKQLSFEGMQVAPETRSKVVGFHVSIEGPHRMGDRARIVLDVECTGVHHDRSLEDPLAVRTHVWTVRRASSEAIPNEEGTAA